MPRPERRLSLLAERALLEVAFRFADQEALISSRAESMVGGTLGRHLTYDATEWRARNSLVDFVAIVESYTTMRLLSVVSSIRPDDISTWPKRQRAWQRHGGVDFTTDCSRWPALQGYIQARNTVQHGLGMLTDQQLSRRRRNQTLEQLSSADIPVLGDRVVVDEMVVANCRKACEQFIVELDALAQGPG